MLKTANSRKYWGRYRFKVGDLENFEKDFWIEKKCIVCKKKFITHETKKRQSRITCGKRCAKKYQANSFLYRLVDFDQLRRKLLNEPPSIKSIPILWMRKLWLRLQNHSLPENEEWIGLFEARRRSGLSNMQLTWLKMRKILTTKPNPAKINNQGQPTNSYAASEIKIAGRLYRKWKKKKELEQQRKLMRAS